MEDHGLIALTARELEMNTSDTEQREWLRLMQEHSIYELDFRARFLVCLPELLTAVNGHSPFGKADGHQRTHKTH